MEANAALVMAMKAPGTGDFQVSLGKTAPDQAIRQVRAIGLKPGDYTLEKVGGDTFLTVTPEGMARLASPVADVQLDTQLPASVQRVQRSLAQQLRLALHSGHSERLVALASQLFARPRDIV